MPSRPISSNPKTSKFLRSRVLLLAITLSATAIFLITIVYILYHLWYTLFRRSRTNPFHSSPSSIPLKNLQKFTYKDLKSATNGFDPDHSIGKGGSATVFRGVLRDGKTVAIKRLEDVAGSSQLEREFQCELSILGAIKSPHIVSLLGYCIEKNKRVLVYEYMPNRSLQELLFSEGNLSGMDWDRRFRVIQDVARALEFLHNECDPPVIHGDIKPSNVLLDWDFRAKISDFGLSRVKGDDEFGVEMFSQDMGRSQDLWKSQDLSGNLNLETSPKTPTCDKGEGNNSSGEVDFALALQASSSTKNGRVFQNLSPKGKEVVVELDGVSGEDWRKFNGCFGQELEHSKELELNASAGVDDAKQWGKDWWWKQDDSGELSSKDYVSEWIGCQINPEWENVSSPIEPNLLENSPQLDNNNPKEENNESPRRGFQLGCVDEKSFEQKPGIGKHGHKSSKPRKMQDWWREEEELDELNKRRSSKRKTTLEKKMRNSIKMPHFDLGRRFYILKRRRGTSSMDCNQMSDSNLNREFSFKKGSWRRKHAHAHTRSMGSEMSGDLFSRELSSTTSMRGTLCYVAPEYGGCGYLVEKGDIYSLGVLILVIISGRRPLHVLNSPMKLEKANLISWCRHLAQSGNVLELVDEKLKDLYDKEQAILCIHLALACLQKIPELRPDIGDVVRILRGEMELPPLPFEFSPSPPPKLYNKSRRKQKSDPE